MIGATLQRAARFRGDRYDDLVSRRDLLMLGLSILRTERKEEAKKCGGISKVPKKHLEEYDVREGRIHAVLRSVNRELDRRMPPGQQRKKNGTANA